MTLGYGMLPAKRNNIVQSNCALVRNIGTNPYIFRAIIPHLIKRTALSISIAVHYCNSIAITIKFSTKCFFKIIGLKQTNFATRPIISDYSATVNFARGYGMLLNAKNSNVKVVVVRITSRTI